MNPTLVAIFFLAPAIAFAASLPTAEEAKKSDPCKVSTEIIKSVDQFIKTIARTFSKPLDSLAKDIETTTSEGKKKVKNIQDHSSNPSTHDYLVPANLAESLYKNIQENLINRIAGVRIDFEIASNILVTQIDKLKDETGKKYPDLKKRIDQAYDSVLEEMQYSIFQNARKKLNGTDQGVNAQFGTAIYAFGLDLALSNWFEGFAALYAGLVDSTKLIKNDAKIIEHDLQNYDFTKINKEIKQSIAGSTTCL